MKRTCRSVLLPALIAAVVTQTPTPSYDDGADPGVGDHFRLTFPTVGR